MEAPSWLHRFIIGRQGANVRRITGDFPRVSQSTSTVCFDKFSVATLCCSQEPPLPRVRVVVASF